MPDPSRCSGCRRQARAMRYYGNGIYWCGRIACLGAVRTLRSAASQETTDQEASDGA